nr:hypothetical protein Iba_chr08fCG0380 [Ipomoea batatas]GME15190.1 hypothetical protein Iba_scaffold15946CG0540 [Ipomoea batatas]
MVVLLIYSLIRCLTTIEACGRIASQLDSLEAKVAGGVDRSAAEEDPRGSQGIQRERNQDADHHLRRQEVAAMLWWD